MTDVKTYSIDELINQPSDKLLWILDECRAELAKIAEELCEAVCNYKTIETILPHKIAQIQVQFLDVGCSRNEALDRAKASPEYLAELNRLTAAYDIKKPLEIKYEALTLSLRCLTSIAYVKNQELKNGL